MNRSRAWKIIPNAGWLLCGTFDVENVRRKAPVTANYAQQYAAKTTVCGENNLTFCCRGPGIELCTSASSPMCFCQHKFRKKKIELEVHVGYLVLWIFKHHWYECGRARTESVILKIGPRVAICNSKLRAGLCLASRCE